MPRAKKSLTLGSSVGLLSQLEVDTADAALPERVNIFTVSPVVLRDGRGPFTYDPQKLIDAFNSNGRDLAINYDHQGVDAINKQGPVPAAGWISGLDYDPLTGIWASIRYWTPTASDALRSREYRDFSPEFFVRGTEIVAVSGGALTNDPAIFDLVPVITSAEKDADSDSYTSAQTLNLEPEMLEKLLTALGLAADADEVAVLASIETLKASAAVAAAVAAEVGADATADAAAIVTASRASFVAAADVALVTARAEKSEADLVAASARADSAENALAEIKAAAHAEKVSASVDAAVAAGKITPAQKQWASTYAAADLAGFEAFVAATPVNAVLAASTTEGQAPADTEIVLTAEQKKRAKLAGLSEDSFIAALKSAQK